MVEKYDEYDGKIAWLIEYLGGGDVLLYTKMPCYIKEPEIGMGPSPTEHDTWIPTVISEVTFTLTCEKGL